MPDIFIASHKEKISAPKKETKKDLEVEKDVSSNLPDISLINKQIHLFSSFCENPIGISFRNQEKDEKILLFLRRSMITNIRWIVAGAIFLVLPIFIAAFVKIGSPIFIFPFKHVLVFTLYYYLIIFAFIFVNFITWYFNIGLITNKRVVDIDFSNLVYKDVAATKLTQVEDVSFEQIGTIPNFFNYGNIMIQTAGSIDNFLFDSTHDPQRALHIIENLIGANENA